MKKLITLLLAMTMLFCTACSKAPETPAEQPAPETPAEQPAPANIFTELTGVAPDATVMNVGELQVPADLYFYYVVNIAREAEQLYQQYAAFYGQYGSVLNSDGTLKWNAAYSTDMTMGDVICLQAMEQLVFFMITERFAATNGVELTDEDRAEIEAQIDKTIDQYAENLVKENEANAALTREEVEKMYFYNLGIERADVARMLAITYLRDGIVDLMLTEGSPVYITDEAYDGFVYYADHILIATKDLATGRDLTADEIKEKTALAEEILKQLQASEDPVAMFGKLIDLHTEDTGHESNPTGYIFTAGQMVAEFENAVKELKPGEISGLVKSTYGYHIILRRDLAEGLELYPERKAAMAEIYMTNTINMILANSSVSTGEDLANIKMSEVYRAYMEKIGAYTTNGQGVQTTDR